MPTTKAVYDAMGKSAKAGMKNQVVKVIDPKQADKAVRKV